MGVIVTPVIDPSGGETSLREGAFVALVVILWFALLAGTLLIALSKDSGWYFALPIIVVLAPLVLMIIFGG